MPLYEYKCNGCGQVFELIQRFSDAPLTQHDGCGGQVERLLSAPALKFKGSGWYITDYAKGGSGSSGNSGEAGSSKSETKSDSGSSTTSSTPAPSTSSDKK